MKSKVNDQEVLKLLTKLKNSEGNYPSDTFSSRRDSFVKQAAAMAVLARHAAKQANPAGNSQAMAPSATANTTLTSLGSSIGPLLETVLVAAIVVEAGVAAYVYKDKIADFINSRINPTVAVVASPPSNILTGTDIPIVTPIATGTITETETPIPSLTLPPVVNGDPNGGGPSQTVSTPEPTNPGLHLGQTKQPTDAPDQNNTDSKNKDRNK